MLQLQSNVDTPVSPYTLDILYRKNKQTIDETPNSIASTIDEQQEKSSFPDTDALPNDIKIDIKAKKMTLKLTQNELEYVEHVLKCCADHNNIDAYQVMAFDNNTRSDWKAQIKYVFDIIKCTLCALTQIFGIIIIMGEVVQLGLEEKEWCNIPTVTKQSVFWLIFTSNKKILAFLFSSFLAYFSIDSLTNVDKGMYFKMKYAERLKWVNTIWLRIGFTVNLFVSIIAVFGSFLVIFFSDNSLDMVLNSVALFFVIELDDLLTKTKDYERIKIHIMQYIGNEDMMIKKPINKDEVNKCKYCCHIFCGTFGQCVGWFFAFPFHIIQYITLCFCLVCPGLVLVCY